MMDKRSECLADIFRLSQKSELLGDELEMLKNDAAELENCLAELSSFWTGTASEAYIIDMRRSLEGLKAYLKSIDNISQNFKFASQTYSKCEERVSEIIGAVDI